MDFVYHYTDEQEKFRTEVREWLGENVPDHFEQPHDSKHMDRETWEWAKEFRMKLGEQGWLYPTYPKEYGGGGLTAEHNMVIQEELKSLELPIFNQFYDNSLDLPAIMVWGTEEQKKDFLPGRLSGDKLAWQLFTEPGAGSDLASLKTRAVKDGDDWVITGEKVFVGGDHGYIDPETKVPDEMQVGEIFCLAITDPNAPRHRNMGYFYIPGMVPGMSVQTLDLLVGHGKRQVYLDNVRVSNERLIGGETQGWQVAQTTLEIEHGGGGSIIPRHATVEKFLNYIRDTGVGSDPHLQQIAMDAFIESEVLRLINMRNYWMYSTKQEMTYHGSQSSLIRKESDLVIADAIRDVIGLDSLLDVEDPGAEYEGEFEHHQRESLAGAHPGGTIEVQRVIIARRIGVSRTQERAAPTPSTASAR